MNPDTVEKILIQFRTAVLIRKDQERTLKKNRRRVLRGWKGSKIKTMTGVCVFYFFVIASMKGKEDNVDEESRKRHGYYMRGLTHQEPGRARKITEQSVKKMTSKRWRVKGRLHER